MKIYKIYFLALFLSINFPLKSMESDLVESDAITKIDQTKFYKPSSLKRKCANVVMSLVIDKRISERQVGQLPESTINYLTSFYQVYSVINRCALIFNHLINSSTLNLEEKDELILKFKDLMNDIDALFDKLRPGLEQIDIFTPAVKEIYELKIDLNPLFGLNLVVCILEFLKDIKQILILLGSKNVEQVDPSFIDALVEFGVNSALLGKISALKLVMYLLNQFYPKEIESNKSFFFVYAINSKKTSIDFVKNLFDLLNITREEFVTLLTDEEYYLLYSAIRYSSLEKINYIFELMEKFQIDAKEYIDEEYRLEENDSTMTPLTDSIKYRCNPDVVKLLIFKGAKIINDGHEALSIAQKKHKVIKGKYLRGIDTHRELKQIESIIDILQNAINERAGGEKN